MNTIAWITRWMLDSALAGAVVFAIGAALWWIARTPARRQHAGEWTLAGCLLAAILAAVPGTPKLSFGLLDPAITTPIRTNSEAMQGIEAFPQKQLRGEQSAETLLSKGPNTGAPSRSVIPGLTSGVAPGTARTLARPLAFTLVILYAAALIWSVARLAAGHWRLRQWTRHAVPPERGLAAWWNEMTADLSRRPVLLISSQAPRPLTYGLWRPVVLLPADWCHRAAPEELHLVLRHELVHVRRADARTWLLASAAQILFFYQPLYWWLRRELRLAQEYIADAWAAAEIGTPETYAANLLRLLQQIRMLQQNSPRLPANVSAVLRSRSEFYRRIERLLQHIPAERTCNNTWKFSLGAALLVVAVGAGSLTLRAERPTPAPLEHNALVEHRGIIYLLSQQQAHGGWMEDVGPAPTALVLKALLQAGLSVEAKPFRAGLHFLESFRQPDHGYYRDAEPVYNTAIVLSVLTLLPGDAYCQRIADARAFLQRAIEPSSSHNAPESTGWYQGASWKSTRAPASQAALLDPDERSADDILTTYGALTYASLKSMIYAGLTKDDPRVKQATQWIAANWTLEKNPGLGTAEGQYYFYHLLARAMHAGGQPTVKDRQGVSHNWAAELRDHLAATQRPDGSWINQHSPRWLEDRPVLVTAYSVLALQETQEMQK